MDILTGLAIGAGSLAIGAAGTIISIRKGTLSVESCDRCKQGINIEFKAHNQDIKDICNNVKRLHDKHDETNKIIAETNAGLKEVIGFLKGKGQNL